MKKYFKRTLYQNAILLSVLSLASFFTVSCDDYIFDDKEPDWLGASIYDFLKNDSNFTVYARLIEDLDYTEVLSKTGSKTLFVADDDAFKEFFKNNEWGVTKYEQFTLAQKKLLLNFGMINNAYLVEMLANYNNGGLKEGAALRRVTAVSVLDSLPYEIGDEIPNTSYWNYYKTKGINILKDDTPWTLIYFTQKHLEQAQISDEDFRIITGVERIENDAHLFGIKIKTRDITCKNGYLNVLEKVMIPPVNMAEYVNTSKTTTLFSALLNRFCGPFFDGASTLKYRQLHPEFSDSIFVKRYFAKAGGITRLPTGQTLAQDLLLPFDPGWNSYERTASGNAIQSDMAAMFVPTDEAMQQYFNSGEGAVLKDRFHYWDSIPFDVLPLLLKRHMRSSLIESVPSRFANMVDEDNSVLPVGKGDIVRSYIGSNGVVYETNKVYPPDDYRSVYGPVLLSANDASMENKTKIWKWAIVQPANDFRLYLNSLVSTYSFMVPTDEYFTKYIDPIAIGKDIPGALKFWYNSKTQSVNATIYKFNTQTNEVGDSVGIITSPAFLANRLLDMLNMHIVVGGIETGKNYYLTKGNVTLKVSGSGINTKIQAGGNITLNENVNVNKVYKQSNGYTYFIDRPIQTPVNSVYKVLSETPAFSAFFKLLVGFPSTSSSVVFVNKTNYFGIDFNIKFFNTFNYTVYVPTNEAIDSLINARVIKPWETRGPILGIDEITDATEKASEIAKLERFLRYHFQDNSIFVDNHTLNKEFQSATMKLDNSESHFNTFKNKYYKIGVNATPGKLELITENNQKTNVLTTNGLYNIMTRDFVFSNKPSSFKNVDGTGTGSEFSTSIITTSSTAVIHQIKGVLNFK
ncbi:MAG TPA: hypothetical protein P5084_09640 [Paludibacter sp.]|nr:hypothetical protein [Paludibacter sp.]